MSVKMKSCHPGSETKMKLNWTGTIIVTTYFLSLAILMSSCTKNSFYDPSIGDPLKVSLESIVPYNLADSVFVDPIISVTFKSDIDPAIVSSTTITLKTGSTAIPGSIKISGNTASFTTENDLTPETGYSATVKTSPKNITNLNETHEYSWKFKTGKFHRISSLLVLSVSPVDKEAAVSVNSPVSVSFNQELSGSMKNSTAITLRTGTANVKGTITYSGNTAIFQPDADLDANKLYTGKVTIGTNNNFTWSFTTAPVIDNTAPTVLSVVPANASTTASTTTKATVTFSEPMNPATINSTTFTLKQGSTPVAGTVTYSGSSATFTPTNALAGNTTYTGTVTTAAKDVAGNSLTSNYIWSFTTAAVADVTAPTILSVAPVSNATSVALNIKPVVNFSEVMDATTITSSTFTLKQGSASVPGSVTYTGTTATFTPSAALTGSTVYTGTITTGVKDASGNPIASSYSWSFTTVATAPAGKSFATAVVPILNLCNTCHTHPWTVSSNASAFYTNLVNDGYVNTTNPTSSKIYTKLNGGHPSGSTISAAQKTTILTWFTEGAKNN